MFDYVNEICVPSRWDLIFAFIEPNNGLESSAPWARNKRMGHIAHM